MMRMHAGCREQHTVACFGQTCRTDIAGIARSGHDYRGNTDIGRTLHHLLAVIVKAVMREIRADIDE
jgi:hypothetical protein